jgi:hypothetical protein
VTLPDTLLVGATDLQSLKLIVADFAGLHAPGTRRGGNITYPNVDGETGVAKVYAAYAFDVPVTIVPDFPDGTIPSNPLDRRAQFIANLTAIQAVLDVGLVTLTRKLAKVGGGTIDTTCPGEYVSGLAVSMLNPDNGRTILQFKNLNGYWADGGGGKHL